MTSESGAWGKHGLDVDRDFQILRIDAHSCPTDGEIEFVDGNHISTYGHRARGDKWVYLRQTLNSVNPNLVVRPQSGINGLADLHGNKIGTRGHHPGLNDWLLLKQRGLDVDRGAIEIVNKVDGLESAGGGPNRSRARAARRKKAAHRFFAEELKDRIMAAIDHFNHDPVVHRQQTRSNRLIQIFETMN